MSAAEERIREVAQAATDSASGSASVAETIRESGLLHLGDSPTADEVEAALRRLATLTNGADIIRREAIRGEACRVMKRYGWRAAAFDAALPKPPMLNGRGDRQGRVLALSDPDPWLDVVNGAALLREVADLLERYVVLPRHAEIGLALWVLHTWCFDAATATPRLEVTSPTPRAGKTRVMTLLDALCRRTLTTASISPAALYRVVERNSPTLLLDETEQLPDELRALLRAGHTRASAYVVRCHPETLEPELFSAWCPVALARIGRSRGADADRCVVISMHRRLASEPVARLREDTIREDCKQLRQRALRWATDHLDALRDADPDLPDELDDRQRDCWRPLVAIADVAGGEWPELVRKAALGLSGAASEDDDTQPRVVQLLADLRELFGDREVDSLPTTEIITHLTRLDDRPWREYSRGKPLSDVALARLLKSVGVRPQRWREGDDRARGYVATSWGRIPALPTCSDPGHPGQCYCRNGKRRCCDPGHGLGWPRYGSDRFAHYANGCPGWPRFAGSPGAGWC